MVGTRQVYHPRQTRLRSGTDTRELLFRQRSNLGHNLLGSKDRDVGDRHDPGAFHDQRHDEIENRIHAIFGHDGNDERHVSIARPVFAKTGHVRDAGIPRRVPFDRAEDPVA